MSKPVEDESKRDDYAWDDDQHSFSPYGEAQFVLGVKALLGIQETAYDQELTSEIMAKLLIADLSAMELEPSTPIIK